MTRNAGRPIGACVRSPIFGFARDSHLRFGWPGDTSCNRHARHPGRFSVRNTRPSTHPQATASLPIEEACAAAGTAQAPVTRFGHDDYMAEYIRVVRASRQAMLWRDAGRERTHGRGGDSDARATLRADEHAHGVSGIARRA